MSKNTIRFICKISFLLMSCTQQDDPHGYDVPLPVPGCGLLAKNEPISEQIVGDCKIHLCNGAGGIISEPFPSDIPDDGNPCTLDDCFGGMAAHTILPYGSCFTGPVAAWGVGVCKGGIQQCDVDGNPVGACAGEIRPGTETCDAERQDEDCDGEVNEEGSNCFCGDGYVSTELGETCDDGGSEDGNACSANCQEQRAVHIDSYGGACALLSGGDVKCWGSGVGDQPNEMGQHLSPANLGTNVDVIAISGYCALSVAGMVTCWELPAVHTVSAYPPLTIDFGMEIVRQFGAGGGGGRMCAVLASGNVKCLGNNYAGELGLGDTNPRGQYAHELGDNLPAVRLGSGKKAVSVSMGMDHVCVILEGGSVKCWGRNEYGQLGLGDVKNRGASLADMGDSLPTLDLGTDVQAISISAGRWFTCALLNNGRVKCWGRNSKGVLGLGDAQDRGASLGEMGDNLAAINLGAGKKAIAVSAGFDHACAILEGGSVKCWGRNEYGQLGLGNTQDRGTSPFDMGDNLPAVELGTGRSAVAVSAGPWWNCAILDDGSTKCWGQNEYGQLGLGDIKNRGDEPDEMGDNLPRIKLFSEVW